jgi:hypothetical protein
LSIDAISKMDAVAAAGREIRRVRAEARGRMKGGLRALYRALELPGANPLKNAHAAVGGPAKLVGRGIGFRVRESVHRDGRRADPA